MYGYMSGWAWLWMTFLMVFWIVVLGVVVFVAVKLGNNDSNRPRTS